MRVHLAERGAHFICDRGKRLEISDKEEEIKEDVNGGNDDQRRVITPCNEQWHEQKDERTYHKVDARAEHVVDLAHVIGGACHRVADGLQVVEGHALAEQ